MKTVEERKNLYLLYKIFCHIYNKSSTRHKAVEGIIFKKDLIEGYEEQIRYLKIFDDQNSFILQDHLGKNMFSVTGRDGTTLIKNFYVGSLFEDTNDFFNSEREEEIEKLKDLLFSLKHLLSK